LKRNALGRFSLPTGRSKLSLGRCYNNEVRSYKEPTRALVLGLLMGLMGLRRNPSDVPEVPTPYLSPRPLRDKALPCKANSILCELVLSQIIRG
jgi:hypothetical protein